MIGLLQRVSSAKVVIGEDIVGAIDRGLMVLVGVERGDTEREGDRLVERLVGYRVFPDADRKLNLSVADIGGGLLLVPQFTLPADTRKGRAAEPLERCAAGHRKAPVRPRVGPGARAAFGRGNGAIRRLHAGYPHQRRTDHVHVAGGSSGMTGGVRHPPRTSLRAEFATHDFASMQ